VFEDAEDEEAEEALHLHLKKSNLKFHQSQKLKKLIQKMSKKRGIQKLLPKKHKKRLRRPKLRLPNSARRRLQKRSA
jgi:hypothetical protein